MDPLPGTNDLWAPETLQWVELETTARQVFACYGYGELRTPVFERTDLFVRGIGGDTEVVQKEMYTFEDRGGRSLTLRPEGTAGVMRAIVNQGLAEGEEKRVFYMGPMFRGERPAAGRKRQFHQIGVEAVGRCSPAVDAECIAMQMDYLARIGLPDCRLLLNSRGTAADRAGIAAALRDHFAPGIQTMCDDCRRRVETNVWRILDCKNAQCQGAIREAPAIVDLLCSESQGFFQQVRQILDALGIVYELAPRLVRGLDYYEHTVFEVVHEGENLGAQNAVAGGGRYRILLPGLKRPIAGVGFAAGMERLLLAKGYGERAPLSLGPLDIFIAVLGADQLAAGLVLAQMLRSRGYRVLAETEGRSMKAQMRTANKLEAPLTLILGASEVEQGVVGCKNMRTGEQTECRLDTPDELERWLRNQLEHTAGTTC